MLFGECVSMCQLSATFIKGHSLAESFVLCNRFIQILNTQLWAQSPSKAAIIIQHHFPATVEENAPIIHNIIISFPWQHQKDCTISNRPKPGQQWSYTEHSLPPAPNKAAIRWWLFFTCPPTGRNTSQPVKTERNQTSSPPSPASTATHHHHRADEFYLWHVWILNFSESSESLCLNVLIKNTAITIHLSQTRTLHCARVVREWESSALVVLRYMLGYFVRLLFHLPGVKAHFIHT